MNSKKAMMKAMVDKRNFVLGMLRNVSIARLCLGCISHRVYA